MNRHTMRDSIGRTYRLMALVVLLILGMEYTEPLFAVAKVQLDPPSNDTVQAYA